MKITFTIAEPPEAAEAEAGRLLFAGPCDFVKGVVAMDGLPEADRPEVCFAGRSNVGKSSLINALTGRKGLARASNTPGRTQEINYFDLGGRLWLVDLPGYGFAKVPKKVREEVWARLIDTYLESDRPLVVALQLLDMRRDGPTSLDEQMIQWLRETRVPHAFVLTKADKTPGEALAKVLAATAAELAKRPAAHPEVLPTSARDGQGIAELRAALAALAAPAAAQ